MIINPDKASADDPIVVLRLTKSQAEQVSHSLSDFLCWSAGFVAGRSDDTAGHPCGLHEARELNIALKRAIDATECAPDAAEPCMRRIEIRVFAEGNLEILEADRTTGLLAWDECIGQIAEMTHPRIKSGRYPMKLPEEWAADRNRRFEGRGEP